MKSTEQTIVNESEKAAANLSKVGPNKKIKALKDKGTLVLVIVVVGVILLLMNTGKSKAQQLEKAKDTRSSETNNVLNKNLSIIEKLKKEAKQKKEVTRLFGDGTPVVGLSPVKPVAQPKAKPETVYVRPVARKASMSKEMLARMNAPTTFLNSGASAPVQTNKLGVGISTNNVLAGTGANSEFIKNQGNVTTVTASKIANPDLTVPAGELIPATMNVAMNSELPGMISAVTERDVYSLTGSNVLIPRGSKLLGQYNSGVVQGQNRFLVVWNRVQLANGVIVTLNSPGTDSLGRSGLKADSIDRHFIERFGTATLLSVLGAATANVGVDSQTQFNSAAQYRSAIAESLNQTASQTLEQDMQIKPTLDKYQGTEVNVFVAHDLDFSVVGTQEVRHVSIAANQEVWK